MTGIPIKTAAGASLVALGSLAGYAVGSGPAGEQADATAAKQQPVEVRTQTIRRTVRVVKHERPRGNRAQPAPPAAPAAPPTAPAAPTVAVAPSTPVAPQSAPPQPASPTPVRTRTSGAGSAGGEREHGDERDGGEREGGDD
jgi:hypothetical protein